jgi:hypothetical protein
MSWQDVENGASQLMLWFGALLLRRHGKMKNALQAIKISMRKQGGARSSDR